MSYPTYLVHFNPNHDKLGRFTFSKGGNILVRTNKIANCISEKVKKDSKEPTGNQNCQLCTWSAEAQFRGIQNAMPRAVYSPRDPALRIKGETIVNNPSKIVLNDFGRMNKNIDSIDGDARFYVHVNWSGSAGGHEFLIIKNGKNKLIMDPQAGTVDPLSIKSDYFLNINYKNSYMARLDDKTFNTELYRKINDTTPMEFDPSKDIPYMYNEGMISKSEYENEMSKLELKHFNPNHDPKTGRFTFSKNQTMDSKVRNYTKVIDSLSDEEYRLFSDGWNREDEKRFIKEYAKTFKDNEKTRVFISKYGNVTLASLETNGLGDDEWNIGWATNPTVRGMGITQENVKEAIDIIRSVSDVPISAIIEESNIPSQRTAEKAGFKDAGLTRMNDGSVRKRYVYD